MRSSDGYLYGVSLEGGTYNCGTVFRMSNTGVVKIIYNFDGTHGCNPAGGLVQDGAGYLYGTTLFSGSWAGGFGVIFRVNTSGKLTVLHQWNGSDGDGALAGLVLGNDGNFYGSTYYGGASDFGVLFKMTSTGAYTILYDFGTDASQGYLAWATPMQHTNGKIYGLAGGGGTYGLGVLYSLDVGLKPFNKLMTNTGTAGQTVQILGQGLTGASRVTFGAGSAAFTVVSDTYMTAKVPATGTTGLVTVTTPTGKLTSNTTFKVIPTLTSFAPITGTVGTSVVLTGTALSQTPFHNEDLIETFN